MPDKKFERFLDHVEEIDRIRAIEHSDLLQNAFEAGKAAQREDDGEHKVTNIGQHL